MSIFRRLRKLFSSPIGFCSCGEEFYHFDKRHPGHNRDFSLHVEETLGMKDEVS